MSTTHSPDEDRILAAIKSGALRTTIGAPPAVRARGTAAEAEKDHQALVDASAKCQADLVAVAAARRAALLDSLPVGQAEFLQTPLAITAENPDTKTFPPHPDDIIVFGHIEPGNSFATFTRHEFVSRNNWVTFWFAWNNGESQPVSLHVSGGLLLNGSVRLFAEGGFFGGGQCSLDQSASLQPLQWWLPDNPNTTPSPAPVSSFHSFPAVAVDNTGWGASQTTKTFPIASVGEGNWDGFVVPPRSSTVIKMILQMEIRVVDGTVDVDFESGDFRVTCPGIFLIRDA